MFGNYVKHFALPEEPRDIDYSESQLTEEEAMELHRKQAEQKAKADQAKFWKYKGWMLGKVKV